MKGNWWHVTRLELTLAIRDREAVIWSLIAPVIMAWLFGSMFAQDEPGPTTVLVDGGVNPAWVTDVFSGLLADDRIAVVDSAGAARVVLPDSLFARLAAGEKATVTVVRDGASSLRANAVAAKAREVMYSLAFRPGLQDPDSPPTEAEVAAVIAATGPMHLDVKSLGQKPRSVAGIDHQLPAMLVMFLMFQLMTFFMVLWVEDIKTGKIKRIVMSPTPMRDLFYAQLASRFLWGLLQVIVILGVGSLLLGVHLDIPWVSFALMLFVYMIAAISLGMFAATFFRTTEKANAVGVIAGLVMAALGGCWWPLEVVSDGMRAVAMALPTGLMMSAMEEFIALGPQAPFPRFNFLALAVMAAVLMPIAIRRMRRQIVN
jgi:ABC-type multidrug transport system permease subunit